LTEAALTSGTFTAGIKDLTSSPTETLRPKFSFSDVYQSTSPVDNVVLNPVGSSAVGIVTFAMIANEGAPANLENVTIQQCRALWSNGIQKLSLFTGNPADTKYVLATGRNDGSGTRSAYLTEWTFGVANLVNQYIVTSTGTSNNSTITKITAVPANGSGTGNTATGDVKNASTLWGNNNVGNGGYSSGSALRTIMGYNSPSVTVYDGETQVAVMENQKALLITWLSSADSRDVAAAGGKILSYNGVGITPIAAAESYLSSGFNEADFKKIATGAYSAWSYQHLYYHGSLSTEQTEWFNRMRNTWLPSGLQTTSNGVRLSDISVSRPHDGFPIVAPL
jgi:hypothetical protein